MWYEFTSRMECRVERNSMIPFDMPSPSTTIHVFPLGDFTYMLLFNNHTKQSATKQIDMLCVLCSRIKLYRPSPSSFCVFCVSAHFGPCKRFTVSPMSYQPPLLCRPVFSVCLHRHARLCFQVQSEYEVMMLVVHVHVSDSWGCLPQWFWLCCGQQHWMMPAIRHDLLVRVHSLSCLLVFSTPHLYDTRFSCIELPDRCLSNVVWSPSQTSSWTQFRGCGNTYASFDLQLLASDWTKLLFVTTWNRLIGYLQECMTLEDGENLV